MLRMENRRYMYRVINSGEHLFINEIIYILHCNSKMQMLTFDNV